MSELPKAYEPKTVDKKWYTFWEKEGYFKADAASKKPGFCIVLPPPNVTGNLHMGHALTGTLEDILVRWKRMGGYEALWVPGTDHAGIATQTVVERHLMKTLGKRRRDFTREAFLDHVWKWKEENQHQILNQLRLLGCSLDWSRLRFTMDEGNNRAVRTVFKKMFDEKLIYRGDYLVNWDPVTQTALADDEVEYEEQNTFLWHFRYPLKDGSGYAQIATTRPETMLGDTAVAISPKDPHQNSFIGKTLILPLMNREIPVITDEFVDPEFGSGMVKVTPAHDPNDYEMGLRHNLPFINIMTPDGKINENGGKFAGLTLLEARAAVVKEMQALDLVEKIEPYVNRVGVSYRSKAIIQPYLSKQWFIRMGGFKKTLREAVQEGHVNIIPSNWQNTYFHWIDNLRDWCISRQLWWGHRIPIWYHKDDPEKMICFTEEGVPPEVAAHPDKWEQDTDVLDTWFSSALWPFSTLGWPDQTPELNKFYPNSVLETGHDILFFWVARMILMGEYVLGKVPFRDVYLHSLIFGKSYWRNKEEGGIEYVSNEERIAFDLGKPIPKGVHFKWEKMSKSKGNVIDPLEVIEQYGTDAIRMALCASAGQSWQIDLDRRRFEDYKNFTNKIWNGARFVFMNLEGDFSTGLDEKLMGLEDHWILSVLDRVIQKVNKNLESFYFDQAATDAYDFFWNEFCANYVEICKPVLFGKEGSPEHRNNKQKILAIVLTTSIQLMHPMAPFITEELFQILKEKFQGIEIKDADSYTKHTLTALKSPACMVSPYPKSIQAPHEKVEADFKKISEIVYLIRNIRGEMKIPPGTAVDVHIIGNDESIKNHINIVKALVRTNTIQFHTETPDIGFASSGMSGTIKIMIPMPHEMQEAELLRLAKEKEKLILSIEKMRTQLNNEEFVQRAPKDLIEKQKDLLNQSESKLKEIDSKLIIIGEK